ncbi:hypothetical protein HK102_007094 [Quaeritorhiza haematococci]|nr:hypothetical protein HK102_007094 [Quaeritorhiza haematococci]
MKCRTPHRSNPSTTPKPPYEPTSKTTPTSPSIQPPTMRRNSSYDPYDTLVSNVFRNVKEGLKANEAAATAAKKAATAGAGAGAASEETQQQEPNYMPQSAFATTQGVRSAFRAGFFEDEESDDAYGSGEEEEEDSLGWEFTVRV